MGKGEGIVKSKSDVILKFCENQTIDAQGDVIVGGILAGPTLAVTGSNDVGMLKGLIQTGVALGPWKQYLQENPLELRRVFVASGAGKKLLGSVLLTGRISEGGGYRFPPLPALRKRSSHHEILHAEKPA